MSDEKAVEITSEGVSYQKQFTILNPHLWNGKKDPYLYTAKLELYVNRKRVDVTSAKIGFRFFALDGTNGFLLNGQPYPLHGLL